VTLAMSKGLPGLSHVDHVGLTVPELDIAVKFYCDVIGGHAAIFQYPELFVSHVRLFLEEQSARKIQSAEAPPGTVLADCCAERIAALRTSFGPDRRGNAGFADMGITATNGNGTSLTTHGRSDLRAAH
jgi:hypothetical protein